MIRSIRARLVRTVPPPILSLAAVVVVVALILLTWPATAQAHVIERVSVDGPGGPANGSSYLPCVSADGRYVAFASSATNLVPGDTNGKPDVFVYDRDSGETVRVSVNSSGDEGNDDSSSPSMSADGLYVAFYSTASNLVAGDNNDNGDVFVYDRDSGETTRVSVDSAGGEANGDSSNPCISADGVFVAFDSYASNLVKGDTNSECDVFVHDRKSHETTRVSVDSAGTEGNGAGTDPTVSADGRYVAFSSLATNLVEDDTNGMRDIFVHDRETKATTRVSVDSDGKEADGASLLPSISADGHFVAFHSDATALVSDDTNATWDVFVHNQDTGETTRVSLSSAGDEADNESFVFSISADGRYVAFESAATNLVSHDTNAKYDVFVHDRDAKETLLASVDSAGTQGNNHSYAPAVATDGRYVAFYSSATNLIPGDTNSVDDVFVHDLGSGGTERVCFSCGGNQANAESYSPSLSVDGRYAAFTSLASNLVRGDTNGSWDVFVRDRRDGTTVRVSVSSAGTQGNGHSFKPKISADGRSVAFESTAANLATGDTDPDSDIFVHDLDTGETVLASVSSDETPANAYSAEPALSADGRYVAFRSAADNLVPDDTNDKEDIFVRDLVDEVTALVSVDSGGDPGSDYSFAPVLSADGRYVAFASYATDLVLGDANSCPDIFVRDLVDEETWRVSVDSAGNEGDGGSAYPSISGDGRYVAFDSSATNLVPGDGNDQGDVFLHDRQTGVTSRVSVASNGTEGDSLSEASGISADGHYVVFGSLATNLVTGDTNGRSEIFVHEPASGETTRVSVDSAGAQADFGSYHPCICGDGTLAGFMSHATNLVPDDTNAKTDVFVALTPPVIYGLNPDIGRPGTLVTITGRGFVGVSDVWFDLTDLADAPSFWVVSDTEITAIAPDHASGTVRVKVRGAGGTSGDTPADDFTYGVLYTSIRGSDRFDTALKLSQAMFPAALPDDSGVVLAPGWESYQEALCGAPLAAAYGGPVLLSSKTVLYSGVAAELTRLDPDHVFCIGLTGTTVADAVKALLPGASVVSINGQLGSVYDMSRKVANALGTRVDATGGDISTATGILTIGSNFPDAIGVSALACAQGWPIILTDVAGGPPPVPLNPSAAATFSDLGITTALKAGTYAQLPDGVSGPANFSGADRYYTCANAAAWAQTHAGLTFTHTALTTGDKFPDALAGGPYVAQDQGMLLLSPTNGPLPAVIANLISANRAAVEHFTFIACIEPVVGQVKALLD